MNGSGTEVAFALIVVAALAAMSWIVYFRAAELGHPPWRVRARLLLLWVCMALAVAGGLLLRGVFPQGLLGINFTHNYATPWFTLSGPAVVVFLAGGVLGMAICAAIAFWAVNSLQQPAEGYTPEAGADAEDQG